MRSGPGVIFRMLQPYYAFYWTYPVPWAGFRRLSRDIEKAAEQSLTIRYSRAAVHAHLSQIGGQLLPHGEVVRLERYADRGSQRLGDQFRDVLLKAEGVGAMVAIVDFSKFDGWRANHFLEDWYEHPNCDPIPIAYDAVHYEKNPFDHFRRRRDEQTAHRAEKDQHRSEIFAALEAINASSWPKRAASLNALGLRTYTGLSWNEENLRKFVKLTAEF